MCEICNCKCSWSFQRGKNEDLVYVLVAKKRNIGSLSNDASTCTSLNKIGAASSVLSDIFREQQTMS
eukprot:5275416-Ditylum_brightwellii.AAC.1